MKYKTKTQGPLNTHFLQYSKQFIQTKGTVTETVDCFNQPQRGNALS